MSAPPSSALPLAAPGYRTMLIALAALVAVYLLVGLAVIVRTPMFQNPDEPAHINYVQQVAADGCCPVIAPGDWDSALLAQLTTARFAPGSVGGIDRLQYEDHQPPLYYLLSAPFFRSFTDDNAGYLNWTTPRVVRVFSLLLGAGVVVAAFAVVSIMTTPPTPMPAPGDIPRPAPLRPVVIAAALFVAFVPQHLAMLASVNNDALAQLVVAEALVLALLWLVDTPRAAVFARDLAVVVGGGALSLLAFALVGLPVALMMLVTVLMLLGVAVATAFAALPGSAAAADPRRLAARERDPLVIAGVLGALVGVGLLTKLSTALLVPVALAAWALWAWQTRAADRWQTLAALLVPLLVLGGLWWARNVSVYGVPDVFGLGAHDAVVVGQPRTAEGIARLGVAGYLADGAATTFRSFWSQPGWMALPLQNWTYALIGVMTALTAAGLVVRAVRALPAHADDNGRRAAWALLGWVALLALAQFVYYNLTFQQFQGRYLFPMIIPLGVWGALGCEAFVPLAARFVPHRLAAWLPVAFMASLVALNGFIIWRVLPLLAP